VQLWGESLGKIDSDGNRVGLTPVDLIGSVDLINIGEISEKNVGSLLIYFELLTSLVGTMLKINSYNQSGVELSKQILYKNLDK